ncbi:ABC transporter substrate-binding protein [Hansschlegelia zhihuaiae]|uniref:taurine ABC transporter substrate-binding protein n=1 Tax=Hansschlegelia zhihuaiae TaxID=405005 RepID=UPI001FDF93EC|nr:ABC transporter substrate-binding protein [Hansschlegelia zhihuaiae]
MRGRPSSRPTTHRTRKACNDSGVNDIAGLKGKTVATPFVSTTHYQLMFALKQAGLGPSDVKVLNMRPPEVAAAWERGDIDATFIWDPVLSKAKASGKVIASAADIAKEGRATFDGVVVDRAFAEANKDFMVKLVKLLADADKRYQTDKAKWTPDSDEVKAVAKWTGADPKSVPQGLAAYRFLPLEQQASAEWLGGGAATALKQTAEFLKEQGKVPGLAPDYGKFVNPEFVKEAGR